MVDETQPDPTQPASPAPEPAQEPAPAAPAPPVEDPATLAPPAESTPQDVAPDPASSGPAATPGRGPVTNPVTVNNYTRRDDSDALEGSWVDVIDGPYAGRYGAYVQTTAHSDQNGYPETILVRTRDARNELLEVEYAHVRPSERTGGR